MIGRSVPVRKAGIAVGPPPHIQIGRLDPMARNLQARRSEADYSLAEFRNTMLAEMTAVEHFDTGLTRSRYPARIEGTA